MQKAEEEADEEREEEKEYQESEKQVPSGTKALCVGGRRQFDSYLEVEAGGKSGRQCRCLICFCIPNIQHIAQALCTCRLGQLTEAATWPLQHGGLRVIKLHTQLIRAPRKWSSQQSGNCMGFYDLASDVIQYYFHHFLLLKAVTNPPTFKGRRCKPYFLMKGTSKNLLPYFKTTTVAMVKKLRRRERRLKNESQKIWRLFSAYLLFQTACLVEEDILLK